MLSDQYCHAVKAGYPQLCYPFSLVITKMCFLMCFLIMISHKLMIDFQDSPSSALSDLNDDDYIPSAQKKQLNRIRKPKAISIQSKSNPSQSVHGINSMPLRGDSSKSVLPTPLSSFDLISEETLSTLMESECESDYGTQELPHLSSLIPPKLLTYTAFQNHISEIFCGKKKALPMLNEAFNFDWSKQGVQLSSIPNLEIEVEHFWDYIALEGIEWCALSSTSTRLFEFVHFTLSHYAQPYTNERYFVNKHPQTTPYTIHLGHSGRLQWFFMFHIKEQTSIRSKAPAALPHSHFEEIFTLITYVFEKTSTLGKYGINKMNLTLQNYNKHFSDISHHHWNIFQEEFFIVFQEYFKKKGLWQFWKNVTVSMHALDYGGNSVIEYPNESPQHFRQYLIESLTGLFNVENLSQISFAIATEITVAQLHSNNTITRYSLLANSQAIQQQFPSSAAKRQLRIFPMAFNGNVCSFQCKGAPLVYARAVEPIIQNVNNDNSGPDEDIISVRSFQGYSCTKQQIGPTKKSFAFGQSIFTGAYCIDNNLLPVKYRSKHAACLSDATSSRPFIKFRQGLNVSSKNNLANFRFEPVIAVFWSGLDPINQTMEYLVDQILTPFIECWNDHGRSICTSLLQAYEYNVPFPNFFHF